MRSKAANSTELAFRAYVRTWGLFRNVMEPYFTQFGISGAQWGVLRNLYRAELEGERSLYLKDLGQRLLVRPPSITGVVSRLEKLGLVMRRASEQDQRAKEVALTSTGRQLVLRVLKQHPIQMKKVLGSLNRNEIRKLYQLMDKMSVHLEEMEKEQGPTALIDS